MWQPQGLLVFATILKTSNLAHKIIDYAILMGVFFESSRNLIETQRNNIPSLI